MMDAFDVIEGGCVVAAAAGIVATLRYVHASVMVAVVFYGTPSVKSMVMASR